MNNFDTIKDRLMDLCREVYIYEPMSKHTTFKIGGKADFYVKAESMAELKSVVNLCVKSGVPYFTVGRGSNLLMPDGAIHAVIIELAGEFKNMYLADGTTVFCGAGVSLSSLCIFARDNGLTGLEFAYGIPGSAGGAAFMNAGAYGGEMKDVICKAVHLTADGNIEEISGNALDFGYRHSYYSDKKHIITGMYFKLSNGDREKISALMDDYMARRKAKQPLEYPSAGSVFKRPEGYFAGALIEECSLKGKRIGDAQVSEKHAGFIINRGNATCKDVCELIELIKRTVWEEKGIKLEQEIRAVRF